MDSPDGGINGIDVISGIMLITAVSTYSGIAVTLSVFTYTVVGDTVSGIVTKNGKTLFAKVSLIGDNCVKSTAIIIFQYYIDLFLILIYVNINSIINHMMLFITIVHKG